MDTTHCQVHGHNIQFSIQIWCIIWCVDMAYSLEYGHGKGIWSNMGMIYGELYKFGP
jgi:hypothetical protein